MNKQPTITEADLQAYIDGQLDDQRRQQIRQYLDENPELSQRLATYQEQNDLLQQLYGNVGEQDSEKFRHYLKHRNQQPMLAPIRVAAAIALMLLGGVIGWSLQLVTEEKLPLQADYEMRQLARDAAYAHAVYQPEVLHPVEVANDQQQHLLKWLSKRLGKPINTPDLSGQGFSLLGGRLLPSQFGPAAQFMYENKSGQRMTLYVVVEQKKNRETAFRYFKEKNINVFYWTDADFGFALSGEFSKSLLSEAANVVYKQLSL